VIGGVERKVAGVRALRPWARLLTLEDGSRWVFRTPHARDRQLVETYSAARIPADGKLARERAFYVTSAMLGLGVVPRTVHAELDGERGVLQRYVEGKSPSIFREGRDYLLSFLPGIRRLTWDSVHGVAILHFVTVILDGHDDNVVKEKRPRFRRLRAFDGELTFPETGHASWSVVYVMAASGPPTLSPRLQRRLARVDVEAWKSALRREGIAEPAIELADHRLRMVQDHGLRAFLSFERY
jgi:hypothetical protein